MGNKVILIPTDTTGWNTLQYNMFHDVIDRKDVCWLKGRIKHINFMPLRFLRRIHLSRKINNLLPLPFKSIWRTCLDDIEWDDDTKYFIIFIDSPFPFTLRKITQLKRQHNICYAILLLNSWIGEYAKVNKQYIDSSDIDYVFSYDYGDSISQGFIFCDMLYSKLPITSTYSGSDIYYIGGNNGRLKTIHDIFQGIKKQNLTGYFRVTNVSSKEMLYPDDIKYNQFIDYDKAVEEMSDCNCILELLRDPHKQVCATLRYYEAVCYNKKLLTNNKNVINLPFYNPDYIHIFEKPEDIDWDWVKERVPVDYHYDGRFSPTHLIDKIIELEEAKEK